MNYSIESNFENSLPTVFDKLLESIDEFIRKQDAALPRHHNQKLGYYDFFRLLMYFFTSGTKSFKLFINTERRQGLLPASLNLRRIAYPTANEGFDRFSITLFKDVFQYLINTLHLKRIPELTALGTFYCIDAIKNGMNISQQYSFHSLLDSDKM